MSGTDKPLTKWTVNELKNELKNRGLSQTGLKAELIDRLQQAMAPEGTEPGTGTSAAEFDPENNEVNMQEDANNGDAEETGGDEVAEGDAEQIAAESTDVEMAQADGDQKAEPAEPAENQTADAPQEAPQSAEEATAADTKPEEQKPPVVEIDYGPEEWQTISIPDFYQTLPLIKIGQLPEGTTQEELQEVLASAHVTAKSIALEEPARNGKLSAYVRLSLSQPFVKPKPKKEPAVEKPAATDQPAAEEPAAEKETANAEEKKDADESKAENEPEAEAPAAAEPAPAEEEPEEVEIVTITVNKPDDVDSAARAAVQKLKAAKVNIKGNHLYCDISFAQTTLFAGNLPFDSDEELREIFETYGALERSFIVRNAAGESKGYGFIEFSLPTCAEKAREDCDKKFREALQTRGKSAVAASTKAQTPSKESKAAEPAPAAVEEETKEAVEGDAQPATANGDGAAVIAEADAPAETKDEPETENASAETKADDAKPEVEPEAKPETTDAEPKTEEVHKPIRLVKADFSTPRTIQQLFSSTLYISNLPHGFNNAELLKSTFSEYGPVVGCTITKNPYGQSKGFGFVEFKRSDHAEKAMKALDGVAHEKLGTLSVSFANPAKVTSSRPMRPGFAGRAPGRGPLTPNTYARGGRLQPYAGRTPPGRGYTPAGRFAGYPVGRAAPFAGRSPVPGRGPIAAGYPGRGAPGAPPYNPQAALARQQMAAMQQMARQAQVQAAAYQRQALQQQQQLAQLQARVQQAEQQRQQAIQEAAALKQRQEAERKAAAAAAKQQQAHNYSQSGYGSGSYNQGNYNSYNAQGTSSSYGQAGQGGASAQPSSGYGASGYNAQGYGSSGYGSQSQTTAAAATTGATTAGGGYNSSQSAYNSQSGYGSQPASGYTQSGYGAGGASSYNQAGYGQPGYQQSGTNYSAGQKREAEYDYQQGGYSGYGSGGYSQGGQEYKRGRY